MNQPDPAEIEAIAARWKGVYAVDGIGRVAPDELPPDIAALLAALATAEKETEREASNHRYWKARCESHGAKLGELQVKLAAAEQVIAAAAELVALHDGREEHGPRISRAPTKREWGLLRLSLANYHTATT